MEWKDIPDHPGYQVSSEGGLRSIERSVFVQRGRGHWASFKGQSLTPAPAANGYLSTKLGTGTSYTVHRLVAGAFLPNPDNLPQVNHKDGDKTNNSVPNLEWCTISQNHRHAFDTGLKKGKSNEDHPMCKFTNEYIIQLRSMDFSKRGAMRQFALNNNISPSHLRDIVRGNKRAMS